MFTTSPRSDNLILVRPKGASLEKEFYQQRRTVKFDQEGSFLAVVRPVIILGQVFGIFPVVGYGAAQADRIRFEVCSLRMFYSVLLQLGGATMSGFSLATFWTTGVEFSKICRYFV
ncbi:uncharacterized protein LOC120415948 [Culex pipiens pallens]|uniref:uncharacterized protein LOC120415948 n=1 Tax=Culex pipiens pallens TaxID=42434 RepID=UPI001953B98D|nr:uncharacterized protein LOC120415948 [Culex pipiens pallens]